MLQPHLLNVVNHSPKLIPIVLMTGAVPQMVITIIHFLLGYWIKVKINTIVTVIGTTFSGHLILSKIMILNNRSVFFCLLNTPIPLMLLNNRSSV
jgi:uncharacterized membrane protein (Fun14 family)